MPILLLALLPVPPMLTDDSGRTDDAQRQINADALWAVFNHVLAPLREVVQEGKMMDCADGKAHLCFPILSAWIADHISKNFTLRLVRRVRLTHRAHKAQIAVLDASLRTHFVRTRTLPVRAPQTPPSANPPASSIFSQP